MHFGWAIKQMHNGDKVRRCGWVSGIWIGLVPADQWGLGSGQPYDYGHVGSKLHPWIGMNGADGSFFPWIPTHFDILATDWDLELFA
jgi:hypothetical protein